MSPSEALHYEVIQHVLVRVCVCALGLVLEILCEFARCLVTASCARGALLRAREGRTCGRGALPEMRSHPVVPSTSRLACLLLGLSGKIPGVPLFHWWRAMASKWIIHGRNCADTVPSNMGTLGLEDGRDPELFIPLLLELRWASPLLPWSSSCVGRSV